MPTKAIIITLDDVVEYLEDALDRKPTSEEADDFLGYLEIDLPQWIKDNAKSWMTK